MENNNVLYVSNSCLPYCASGIRITNISKMLHKCNYKVFMLSKNDYLTIPEYYRKNLFVEKKDNILETYYNDLNYLFSPPQKNNRLLNMLELFSNNNQFNLIKKICKNKKINIIILYNPVYKLCKKVYEFSKRNSIKLIIDNTEWYDANVKNKFDKFVARSVNKRILKLDKKVNKIISISPWMNKWYKDRNINSILIPPLMTAFSLQKKSFHNDKIVNIIYCGIPGAKDLLIPFVNCIKTMNSKEFKFRLMLIGVEKKYFNNDEMEKYNIFALGKVPHSEVFKYYETADFSCLFRKNLRYAKAGFSTKVAESLSQGVPVLCNIVGGTDDVIENGVNGFKISEFNEAEILKMLEMISTLTKNQIYDLKGNSYKTAKKLFDMDAYVEKLKDFIK